MWGSLFSLQWVYVPSSFPPDRSKAVLLLLFFVCGFICGVCFVLICSSSLLLLMPWEGCESRLWHYLGIFTYSFDLQLFSFSRLCSFLTKGIHFKILSLELSIILHSSSHTVFPDIEDRIQNLTRFRWICRPLYFLFHD